jgi:hypothetical protein
MRFKFLCSVALITVLVGVAVAWRSTTFMSQSGEPATIKVVINQLPEKDGVVPLEIILPTISSSATNKLEDFTYIVRNNSAKAISAVAVSKTITYVEMGQVYATSSYSMMDYAFHQDMGRTTRLQPATQTSVESGGPLSFDEGVVIKEITLKVDFVLYDDNSALGLGGEGERRINAMREGARAYKNWLGQKYSRGGKSLTIILPLIQAPRVPEELKLSLDQTLGADRYRLYLLQTLQTKGSADVERYFKQSQ